MGLTKKFILNPVDVIEAVLAGDGSGSGLDADLVDGQHAADLLPSIDPVTGHWIIGGEDTGIGAIVPEKASASEAVIGTNDTKFMTPFATKAVIADSIPDSMLKATAEEAIAGIDDVKYMTAAATAAALNAAFGAVVEFLDEINGETV